MILGIATTSALRGRLERALADEPDLAVVDVSAPHDLTVVDVAGAHDSEVVLPADPVRHLTDLLGADVRRRSGADTVGLLAHTRQGRPHTSGIGVGFPAPIGPLWARRDDDVLVAGHEGPLSGIVVEATGHRGTVRHAIVDTHDFLATVGMAIPVIVRITGENPPDVARRLGIVVAEFIAT